MATQITLSGPIAETLQALAEQQNLSVEAVIERLRSDANPHAGTLAQLAASARAADIHTGATDTAQHSRQILRDEYAEHLKRRNADGPFVVAGLARAQPRGAF